jgi:hypothetical protein
MARSLFSSTVAYCPRSGLGPRRKTVKSTNRRLLRFSALGLLPLGMLITGVAAAVVPPAAAILAAGAVVTAGLFIVPLQRSFIRTLD